MPLSFPNHKQALSEPASQLTDLSLQRISSLSQPQSIFLSLANYCFPRSIALAASMLSSGVTEAQSPVKNPAGTMTEAFKVRADSWLEQMNSESYSVRESATSAFSADLLKAANYINPLPKELLSSYGITVPSSDFSVIKLKHLEPEQAARIRQISSEYHKKKPDNCRMIINKTELKAVLETIYQSAGVKITADRKYNSIMLNLQAGRSYNFSVVLSEICRATKSIAKYEPESSQRIRLTTADKLYPAKSKLTFMPTDSGLFSFIRTEQDQYNIEFIQDPLTDLITIGGLDNSTNSILIFKNERTKYETMAEHIPAYSKIVPQGPISFSPSFDSFALNIWLSQKAEVKKVYVPVETSFNFGAHIFGIKIRQLSDKVHLTLTTNLYPEVDWSDTTGLADTIAGLASGGNKYRFWNKQGDQISFVISDLQQGNDMRTFYQVFEMSEKPERIEVYGQTTICMHTYRFGFNPEPILKEDQLFPVDLNPERLRIRRLMVPQQVFIGPLQNW